MKILITVPVLSPGSGLTRYVFSLCRILCKGNNILILETHGHSSNDYAKDELMDINPDIKLITTDTTGRIQKYLKNIIMTRRFKPDVIISNYNALTQFILPFCKKKAKVLHILHNDTDDFYRIASINGKIVNGWIAPTKAIADNFNAYTNGKFSDKVSVISHGVESNELKARNNKRLEIVYAGVLYEHKGVKQLPDIIRNLHNTNIDFHFTIIGGGVLSNWLSDKFKDSIQAGSIEMTGVIDHHKVYEIMSQADIFLYPTHLDAFGLVIAEAMMNGAIPIVTLLPGITDNLIDDGINGFLLNLNDSNGFANRILQLAKDDTILNQMREAAHTKAINKFSLDMMARNYIDYLDKINCK